MFYQTLKAQQIPLFTQYREMQGVINPATINYDFFTDGYKTSFGATIRQQWSDITGSPATQILRGEHFMADRTGFAPLFGGYVIRDQTGPTGFTGVYGRFGGVFTADPEFSGLSIALVGGAVQYRVNTSQLKLRDPNDIRAQEDRTQIYPDLGAGIYYYQRMDGVFDQDYFYAGLSVPQMFGLDLTFPTDDSRQFRTKRVQHFYANVGWYHFLTENSFIEPTAWVKYTAGVPLSIDLNVRYQMPNFWVGLGTSLQGNLHGETGLIIGKSLGLERNFKIGYGFDYSFQSYGPYVGATHEVNLSFAF
ncbi:MAG: PorP/SprF family type IX secretion system membrane protein [Saprospiraceae bacterium]|nr:PorP/SprF family type IX secretion system membrane protein [Saprospiraceae bacterium]